MEIAKDDVSIEVPLEATKTTTTVSSTPEKTKRKKSKKKIKAKGKQHMNCIKIVEENSNHSFKDIQNFQKMATSTFAIKCAFRSAWKIP